MLYRSSQHMLIDVFGMKRLFFFARVLEESCFMRYEMSNFPCFLFLSSPAKLAINQCTTYSAHHKVVFETLYKYKKKSPHNNKIVTT